MMACPRLYRVAVPGVTIGSEAIVMVVRRAVHVTVVALAASTPQTPRCSPTR